MKYNEKAPSIGVIIPVYNSAKWLRTCLDSVVGQTIPFAEIIIINDGSIDESGAIAEEYAATYDTIQLINQTNAGAGCARNVGMERIRTDYYLFLDSDDFLHEGTVEVLQEIITDTQVDVVYFNGRSFLDDGADEKLYKVDCRRRDSLSQSIITGRELFAQSYPDSYFPSPCFNMVRRKYINRCHMRFFEDRSYYEDNSFAFFVMDRAERVRFVPNVLYMRRYRDGSIMTSTMCVRKLQDLSKEYSIICRYVKENKEICKNMVCVLMVQNLMLEVISHIHANSYENDFKNDESVVSFFEEYKDLQLLVDTNECIRHGLFINEKRIVLELKELLETNYDVYHLFDVDDSRANVAIDQFYERVLSGFMFSDPGKRIGLYGAGKHTEGILRLYNHYYGDPLAELYIIQTIKDTDNYMGYPVITIDEMEENSVDLIIISSFKFRNEMRGTLSVNNSKTVIIDIYDSIVSDIFADQYILSI